jgi:hypothetical protein
MESREHMLFLLDALAGRSPLAMKSQEAQVVSKPTESAQK